MSEINLSTEALAEIDEHLGWCETQTEPAGRGMAWLDLRKLRDGYAAVLVEAERVREDAIDDCTRFMKQRNDAFALLNLMHPHDSETYCACAVCVLLGRVDA